MGDNRLMMRSARLALPVGILLFAGIRLVWVTPLPASSNLIVDPSFELTKPRDANGRVFSKWEGWKFEGDCGFEVGQVARTGKTSALLACSSAGKIRINQPQDLAPGRYRIQAYIRGLDIGLGEWNNTTEFMFNDKYFNLSKSGSFGWTPLTYVVDLAAQTKTGPSFGLWGPGLFWIDDVSMERVGNDVSVTAAPVLGKEEAPIAPPGPLGANWVRCPRCQYRNRLEWDRCYGCGTKLERGETAGHAGTPPVRLITSFEDRNPFGGGTVVSAHATDGSKALRIDRNYVTMQERQDWSGYDFLMLDVYTDAKEPQTLGFEFRDIETTGYWTRVNYATVAPPGKSTLTIPLKQLYVGEKSRPGHGLILSGITRVVLSVGEAPKAPVFIDNIRLQRDEASKEVLFDGLYAFDFGTGASPVMDGFTQITPGTLYNENRGYGLKNAKIWRTFDALQPDPLYQDFICIEAGGLTVDVPNGKYRVFVNMDSPAGFWGENQAYKTRAIVAQGKTVVSESQTFQTFLKKIYQFWDKDDLPSENVFEKYDRGHFSEKTFDVDVKNGHLSIEFNGENWACSVSAVVIFPVAKAKEGARFLQYVLEKRRFYFNNAFKRVLHTSTGDPLQPTDADKRRGYVLFQRDFMRDLYYNDLPFRHETGAQLSGDAFAGQQQPVTFGVVPLKVLGTATVTVSALTGPQGAIPANAIEVGYGSYRLSRVIGDGSVYTVAPRFVMPKNNVAMEPEITRQFWLTVHTPVTAAPGMYSGRVNFTPRQGQPTSIPFEFTVHKGALDAVDIPAGPFGGPTGVSYVEGDAEATLFAATMTEKSLRLMRAAGFTMFTGVPYIVYRGFEGGKPVLDFSNADRQMAHAREYGFLAVDSYGTGLQGLTNYYPDLERMKAAGFSDYSTFIRAVYSAVEQHAKEKNWLPVYWNIGDEPAGDQLKSAAENAAAYRKAFPAGPPFFSAATSLYNHDAKDPHFALAEALQIPALSLFDEEHIRELRKHGDDWAYYNNGSRWTFGEYLYKSAKEFNLKFRVAWHWNASAGDPYYALDCREDDYAWANATPDERLIPSLDFLRITAGITDYRYLLTLARLAKEKTGTPASEAAQRLIDRRMKSFGLGEYNKPIKAEDWVAFRSEITHAIDALRP